MGAIGVKATAMGTDVGVHGGEDGGGEIHGRRSDSVNGFDCFQLRVNASRHSTLLA